MAWIFRTGTRVGVKEYTSKRVRFMQWSSSGSWAGEFVAKHQAGTPVKAYYDPADPKEAVLLQGLQGFDYFMGLFMTPFTGGDGGDVGGDCADVLEGQGVRGVQGG